MVPTLNRGHAGYRGDAEGGRLTRASGAARRPRPRAELELERAGGRGAASRGSWRGEHPGARSVPLASAEQGRSWGQRGEGQFGWTAVAVAGG